MSGACEDLQLRPGHRRMGHPGVTDRDHHIAFAPDELHRNRFRQITPVQHGHHLAAPVDHGTKRACERRGRGGLGEVPQDPQHMGQFVAHRG